MLFTPHAQRSRKVSYRGAAFRYYEPRAHSRKLKLEGDEQFGVTIVRRACEEPIRQIALNGGTEGAIVVEKIKTQHNANFGFNAASGQYEDLVKAVSLIPRR